MFPPKGNTNTKGRKGFFGFLVATLCTTLCFGAKGGGH